MNKKKERTDQVATEVEVRDQILNSLNIAIYVSDLTTNEILYANLALRQMHGDQTFTGGICWEVLQNKTRRCEFCPIPYLLKHPGRSYHREVYNGRHLKIHDSIIPWKNGKLAHLQYAVDITKEYP